MAVRLLFLIAAVVLALPAGTALAAPQILAALPSATGLELKCENGYCRTSLTTYCLQRRRPAPTYGAVYLPATPKAFTLAIEAADGSEKTFAAGDHLHFIESRGFMAVSAQIREADLTALGAELGHASGTAPRAVIRIADNASLIPMPVEGDPNPLTEKEIAYATGSLREQSASIVDDDPKAAAAQVLARLAGKLPNDGVAAPALLEKMWQQAIGDELPDASPLRTGIPIARQAFEDCLGGSFAYRISGMRRCVDYRHDDLIRGLNVDYWDSNVGS